MRFPPIFGLPALTLGTNFNITYLPTQSDCISADQVEINLDVEMSHTIAPGANINLLVPPSASFQDIDQAWYTAIDDAWPMSSPAAMGRKNCMSLRVNW